MKLIVACDPDGGIGYQNKLPWDRLDGDLPRFKQLTTSGTVVMGRNTWESLPKKPLPNRTNIIVTTSVLIDLPDATIISDPKYAPNSAWLIGGAKLINSCWSLIDEIYLTKVFDQYTCDTFINLLQLYKNYECYFEENHTDHTYSIWKRK